jgi:predicted GNAT family acetyltransferase
VIDLDRSRLAMVSIEVTDNETDQRFEIHVDGALAGFAQYRPRPDALVFTHTEIFDGYEGQGIGSKLARGALDDVRSRGVRIRPLCPFIAAYIDRHPAYQELVVDRGEDVQPQR